MDDRVKYRTIVVDPPWPQVGGGSLRGREGFIDAGGRSLPLPYPTMTVAEIRALPVGDIAERDAHLYLWVTSRFIEDGFSVLRAWGFRYTEMLVWVKEPIGHGLGGDFGICTEMVLRGKRGSLPALAKVGRNWWQWKRPSLMKWRVSAQGRG